MLILSKIWLGIALAAPIGPVSIEMIKRGLSQGFMASFSIRLGGALGNLLCLILTCFGLSFLNESPTLVLSLSLIGAFLLFYLGYSALTKKVELNLEEQTKAMKSGLLWGFYLAIFNPIAFAFWPGIFASSITDISSIGMKDFLQNAVIIVGVLIWGAFLSFLASLGKKTLNQRKANLITKVSGSIIILYSFKMFFNFIQKIYP